MTQRERQASGGVTDTARPVGANRAGPAQPAGSGPLWEDLFRSASPAQQRELLSLASRQGLLYSHQLPARGNGSSSGTSAERGRQLLPRLLGGQTPDLEPLRITPVAVLDQELDEVQREAVARALQTPDLCLIQGLPGTGKSRVVAEIVTQAAAQGERVLLLAPLSAALDRVLGLVADREVLCPIRCVGREERVETLPPASQAATLSARLRRFQEESLPAGRAEVQAAEEQCQGFVREEALWPQLLELAEQRGRLGVEGENLSAARERIGSEVEQEIRTVEASGPGSVGESSPLAVAFAACLRRRDETLARLAGELAKVRAQVEERHQQQQELTTQLNLLRPLAEAREQKRWWTRTWWRATFHGNVLAQVTELRNRQQQVQSELHALEQQTRRLGEEQEQEKQRFETERSRLVAEEIGRRQTEADERLAAWQHEEDLLRQKWQAACQGLQSTTVRDFTPAAIEEARTAWQQLRRQAEERLAFARQWLTYLETTADTYPARLLSLCNLVAATTTALPSDEHFGEAVARTVSFDLLILDAAQQVTESEFLQAARRARRWVLVGEPSLVAEDGEARERSNPSLARHEGGRRTAPARSLRPAALRPGFFQRLWQHLHCNPCRLPYSWRQEPGGLCCQLRPVVPEQSQWLESERVADFPDIELRILAMPRCEPLLAEVRFPPSMSISQAKEYIFRELQELPVRPAGGRLRWVEDADRVVLRLADQPTSASFPVVLEPGVREMLSPPPAERNGNLATAAEPSAPACSWQTCCVEFERSAGWHRQRAEDWVQQYLGLRDLGRTAWLDVPHRAQPDLALFLSDWLFAGAYRTVVQPVLEVASSTPAGSVPVEFVPVPCGRDGGKRGTGQASGQRGAGTPGVGVQVAPSATLPRKGGAGLELDLADLRHRDRLPSELRARLPERGLVNYLEAEAVVRVLEGLVQEPGLRQGPPPQPGPDVAVMALYSAQAELLRCLVQQSPTLSATNLHVEIDLPEAFGERECRVALVSLTRSHSHRAVNYGDGPASLELALTRPRTRLILFGDPGTLARRVQWETALDPLDEAASRREHDLITQLVTYIQGQGPHPDLFRVREGRQA